MNPVADAASRSGPVVRHAASYVHWVFPALLTLAALGVLVSGRDLAEHTLTPEDGHSQVGVPGTVTAPLTMSLKPQLTLAFGAEPLL